jgi:hypothetical protein
MLVLLNTQPNRRNHMTSLKNYALGLAVVGALGATSAANAIQLSTITDFCTNGTDVTEGLFTYSCITAASTFDPAAPEALPTDLPGDTTLIFDSVDTGTEIVGTFNISGLSALTQLTATLSYFVEITPGGDAEADPQLRFTTIGHGADVDSGNNNVGTNKYIVGQNNAVVTDASFTATLATTPDDNADIATCGVCRKFAVTDTINRDFVAANPTGIILSTSNTFRVALVPIPGTLALFGMGLLGAGIATRRRKAA